MNDSPPPAEAPNHEALPEGPATDETSPEQPGLDADGSWLEQAEELPARPRRRILAPLPVALLLALAIACGFIAGVLVQKDQGGSTSAGGSVFAARLAGLRGASGLGGTGGSPASGSSGSSGATGRASSGSTSGADSTSGFAGGSGLRRSGADSATIGQVAYVSGSTLYVTTAEGNTVKVTAAAGSKVTKTVETHVKGIHPGETVVVSGTANASGSISANAIRAGDAGGLGGSALFGDGASGGGSSGSGSSASGGGTAGSTGGGPALFGKE